MIFIYLPSWIDMLYLQAHTIPLFLQHPLGILSISKMLGTLNTERYGMRQEIVPCSGSNCFGLHITHILRSSKKSTEEMLLKSYTDSNYDLKSIPYFRGFGRSGGPGPGDAAALGDFSALGRSVFAAEPHLSSLPGSFQKSGIFL